MSRTKCEILIDFAVVELILSVCGVGIWVQCMQLCRLVRSLVDLVVFRVFAYFDVRCNSGHMLVSYLHGLAALRALSGENT